MNNRTGEVHLSHIHMELSGQWNSMDHVSVRKIAHVDYICLHVQSDVIRLLHRIA